MTVNWNHPWIAKYADYITHFKSEAVSTRSEKKEEPQSANRQLSVSSVFKINRMLRNVFLATQMDPEALYSLSEARSVLNAYIQTHSLVNEENPSVVVRLLFRSED